MYRKCILHSRTNAQYLSCAVKATCRRRYLTKYSGNFCYRGYIRCLQLLNLLCTFLSRSVSLGRVSQGLDAASRVRDICSCVGLREEFEWQNYLDKVWEENCMAGQWG